MEDFEDFEMDPLLLQETPTGDVTPQVAQVQAARPVLTKPTEDDRGRMTIWNGPNRTDVQFVQDPSLGPQTYVNGRPYALAPEVQRTPRVWDTTGMGTISGPSQTGYVLSADGERQVNDLDDRIARLKAGQEQGGPANDFQKQYVLQKLQAQRDALDPQKAYGRGSVRGMMSPAAKAFQKFVYTDPKTGVQWYTDTKGNVKPFHNPHMDNLADARKQAAQHAADTLKLRHQYWKDALAAGYSHDDALRMATEAVASPITAGAVGAGNASPFPAASGGKVEFGMENAGGGLMGPPKPGAVTPKQQAVQAKMTQHQEKEFHTDVVHEAKAIRDINQTLWKQALQERGASDPLPSKENIPGYIPEDKVEEQALERVLQRREALGLPNGDRMSKRKLKEREEGARERAEFARSVKAMPLKPTGGIDLDKVDEQELGRLDAFLTNSKDLGITEAQRAALKEGVRLAQVKRKLANQRLSAPAANRQPAGSAPAASRQPSGSWWNAQ